MLARASRPWYRGRNKKYGEKKKLQNPKRASLAPRRTRVKIQSLSFIWYEFLRMITKEEIFLGTLSRAKLSCAILPLIYIGRNQSLWPLQVGQRSAARGEVIFAFSSSRPCVRRVVVCRPHPPTLFASRDRDIGHWVFWLGAAAGGSLLFRQISGALFLLGATTWLSLLSSDSACG